MPKILFLAVVFFIVVPSLAADFSLLSSSSSDDIEIIDLDDQIAPMFDRHSMISGRKRIKLRLEQAIYDMDLLMIAYIYMISSQTYRTDICEASLYSGIGASSLILIPVTSGLSGLIGAALSPLVAYKVVRANKYKKIAKRAKILLQGQLSHRVVKLIKNLNNTPDIWRRLIYILESKGITVSQYDHLRQNYPPSI